MVLMDRAIGRGIAVCGTHIIAFCAYFCRILEAGLSCHLIPRLWHALNKKIKLNHHCSKGCRHDKK